MQLMAAKKKSAIASISIAFTGSIGTPAGVGIARGH
jgi:hypothetical protein